MYLLENNKTWEAWVLITVFVISMLYLAFIPAQHEFFLIIIPYAVAFAIYLLIFQSKQFKVIDFQWIGILIRVALIFSIPNLSDDIYRYLWDGQLSLKGLNPYILSPDQISSLSSNGIDQELYDALNSKPYKTVYPPLSQVIFLLGSLIPIATIKGKIIVLKFVLIAFEIANVILLPKILKSFSINPKNAALYILNPLIILELSGSVHLEGMMVFFILLGLLAMRLNKSILSALGFAASIAVKMLPLMLIPFIFLKWKGMAAYKFLAAICLGCFILFLPVFAVLADGAMYQSLDLYFRNFEFNGSLYYVLRFIYFKIVGYNLIGSLGPIMAGVSGILIIFMSVLSAIKNKATFFDTLLFIWTIYLLFATTVHPWYLTGIILFACMSKFRFPILWSLLIFFSYINYSFDTYLEPWWSVFIQYSILFSFMIYEFFGLKRLN